MLNHRPTPPAQSILRDVITDGYLEVGSSSPTGEYIRECHQIAEMVHPHLGDQDQEQVALDLALSVAGTANIETLAQIIHGLDWAAEDAETDGPFIHPRTALLVSAAKFGAKVILDVFSKRNVPTERTAAQQEQDKTSAKFQAKPIVVAAEKEGKALYVPADEDADVQRRINQLDPEYVEWLRKNTAAEIEHGRTSAEPIRPDADGNCTGACCTL